MKRSKALTLAALSLLALSCGPKAVIDGTLHEAPGAQVVVKLLDVNRFQVLDTLKTDEQGHFRFKYAVAEGQPEFVYLFYGDRQVASLLLQAGDRVSVQTDTLGVYTVEGSEESALLQQVEKDYSAFRRDLQEILDNEAQPDAALSRRYVQYYRSRVSYVLEHSHSLTSVPVLFQQVSPALPVFSQATDGIVMRTVADSLKSVYPESRYVKALEKEAARRMNRLEVQNRMDNATEIGYIDIALPGMDGKPVKLSESLGKVTLLYFWASTAEQKMFNLDSLVPLYEEFHQKGFEIYAVSLDADKVAWAGAVRNQNLPWVNVCDTRGAQSPYVAFYGIGSLPMVWFLVDGEIDPEAQVRSAADIRSYLRRKL